MTDNWQLGSNWQRAPGNSRVLAASCSGAAS